MSTKNQNFHADLPAVTKASTTPNSLVAQPTQVVPVIPQQWLTLKEASEFLGIHFTTLRHWADGGSIPVFRTPGGHRRFSAADLRRFLEERVSNLPTSDEVALIETAVDLARHEIKNIPHDQLRWHYKLNETANHDRQKRGRQLFALAISFVLKPTQRTQILEDGRKLGWEYGQEASTSGVSLVAAGRAVRFFRSQLIEAMRHEETPDHLDADDVRVQRLLDQFLDEVLFAVLERYEENLPKEPGALLGA
ncbi:MAG: helix-turn-helix domain-containing protein [Chloroflexi bacterium]|nr:helix-turn-helix domain-containing protein [Chloroflexota bacterium]